MPEHRPFPYKYLPKMGVQLGVTFGDPIPPNKIMDALNALRGLKYTSSLPGIAENFIRHSGPQGRSGLGSALPVRGWMEGAIVQAGGELVVEPEGSERRAQMDEIRSEVTAVIQRAVEELGRKVSGNKLDHPLPHQNGDQFVG